MGLHQIDCFKIMFSFWKFLSIWPGNITSRYYNYYSKAFIIIFVIVYYLLFSINFYFLPRQLDIFIEEMIFYFTFVAVLSKVLTFLFMRNGIAELLDILESEMFQPDDAEGLAIIENAKKFIGTYWRIQFIVSYFCSAAHLLSPILSHLILKVELVLPVCRYSFFSDDIKQQLIYILYLYQSLGIHFVMMYNISVDTFFLGLMVLTIAQLDILDVKLRKLTNVDNIVDGNDKIVEETIDEDAKAVMKMIHCIKHFHEVSRFCTLLQKNFSATLFVQFSVASCVICVCLFRSTMPAPLGYYIFLASYMAVMIVEIMVPCWFGTRIIYKSELLAFSTYYCDWSPRSRKFKSIMRLFIERVRKPLSITGGKMFCLSLDTFTSIMNSAYSFFTLLKNVQRD